MILKKIIWVMLIITIMVTVSCINKGGENSSLKSTIQEETNIVKDEKYLKIEKGMSLEKVVEVAGESHCPSYISAFRHYYILSDEQSVLHLNFCYSYETGYMFEDMYVLFNPDTDKEEKITLEEYLDRKK